MIADRVRMGARGEKMVTYNVHRIDKSYEEIDEGISSSIGAYSLSAIRYYPSYRFNASTGVFTGVGTYLNGPPAERLVGTYRMIGNSRDSMSMVTEFLGYGSTSDVANFRMRYYSSKFLSNSRGALIKTIKVPESEAIYPSNGIYGNYWYVLVE